MDLCQRFCQNWAMRIGELAKRTGLSRDTIRFYERHGLIRSEPGPDPTNSYRDYPEDLIERLDMIGQAQDAGFTIADLSLLISVFEGGVDPDFDTDGFLDAKIGAVEAVIARAERFLAVLKATRSALEGPH